MDKGSVGAFCPGGGDREEGRCICGRKLEMYEIHVTPTTGGQFQLRVAASDTIEYLRKLVSKRLRVPKERICLLYRDRHLRAGSLEENYIMEGARITLLPSVETGLLTQRPEQSVMQALESLNDAQVNDFLTGKAPLNLTMRLGDHMMLIQLQLSTVSPTGSSKKSSSRHSSSSSSSPGHHHHHHHHYHHHHHHPSHHHSSPCNNGSVQGTSASPPPSPSSLHHHHHYHHTPTSQSSCLSTPPHHNHTHHSSNRSSPSSTPNSPTISPSSPVASPSYLPFESDLPIRGCPHQAGITDPKASLDTKALAEASRNLTQTLKQLSSEVLTTKPGDKESTKSSSTERRKPPAESAPSSTSTSADPSGKGSSRRQGAIIESMHHHGKGVYSGTFSGTLNPALQDRQGRPKRDISTIIHILNDLLCATPQYRRHSASATSYSISTSSTTATSFASSSGTRHSSHGGSSSSSTSHRHAKDVILDGGADDPYGIASRIASVSDEDESAMDENQVTRSKMEHLRFIMEQRRVRRKARREARASPYAHPQPHSDTPATTSWSSEATTLVASKPPADPLAEGGTQGSIDVEGGEETKDPAALCELNSGTVVA